MKYDTLLLKSISANFPGGLYWKDCKGFYVGCNDWFANVMGLKKDDIIGKKDEDLFSKKEAEDFLSTDAKALHDNKTVEVEHSLLVNTEERMLLFKKIPLQNEKAETVGLLGMVNKVERPRTDFLEDIIAMIPVHVYWQDSDNVYLGCNDLQAKSVGLSSRHDIVGKNNYDMPWKEHADVLNKINAEVRRTGVPHVVEEDSELADGEMHTFLSTKAPLRNKEGEIIGIVGISVDITDKKKAEALERENALKEIKMEAINSFCRKLLHDIRSPLSSLRLLFTLLSKATIVAPKGSRLNFANMKATAFWAIRRMEAMANKLLRKYREEETEEDLEGEPTLLMPIVEDTFHEKRGHLSLENIKLEKKLEGAHTLSSKVQCFELVQIFSNIINNSVDAITEKREKTGAPKGEGVVSFKMSEKKEHVYFAVTDNGCGIPQDLLEEIFKKDKTTKEEGSGIGLFNAKEGIENWGGTIWATSREGESSTINILLPKAPKPPSWFASEIVVRRNSIVALVDDEPHHYPYKWTKDFEAWEKEYGIEFVKINTLSEFAEWYEKNKEKKPLIFMDYLFLNEDQKTGLDAIKENDVKNVILITNLYDDRMLRKDCVNSGVKLIPKSIIERIPIKIIE